MKSSDIAARIFASGVLGICIFIGIIFLYAFLNPPDPHPDVVEGWAAGFAMILAAVLSMFISGALAMLLTFNDISSSRYALAIPFSAGLVTVSVPLLLVLIMGVFSLGLLFLGLIVIAVCLFIAEAGGVIVYMVLWIRKKLKRKTRECNSKQ